MPTALIVLADGFEEIEAVTVIDLLRRARIGVTVAGLRKGPMTGSHQITIIPDQYYKDVHQDLYDILILPGGQPGTDNLKAEPLILDWIRDRFEKRLRTAAICAAPIVLHAAGITDGMRLTSYPSEKDVFSGSVYSEQAVVKDGTVITSRGVGTAIDFALAVIEELEGKDKAGDIARRILYNPYAREN